MPDTSKYTAYKNKFQKDNYDRVNLIVAKGKKEIIQSHAQVQNESLSGFINRAIDEAIARDKAAKS